MRWGVMRWFAGAVVVAAPAWSQVPGRWNEGAETCATSGQPSLEMHPYDAQTFILRENPCATFEAPFMYLLVGSTRALLIDDGDVADPRQVPLATTVRSLTPLAFVVLLTHRNLDHGGGDAQFAALANAEVVGYDLESVTRYYHFTDWPNGVAQVDLGGRVVDVIPTPGHNETHVAFYDENTELFFSGDFLMPGRLLIDDAAADLASATRVAAFVTDRPVAYVLGGHIEVETAGKTFPWEST
jgi:hydroxyacylglutathione hydrolase